MAAEDSINPPTHRLSSSDVTDLFCYLVSVDKEIATWCLNQAASEHIELELGTQKPADYDEVIERGRQVILDLLSGAVMASRAN
jgi:hypothetical protein